MTSKCPADIADLKWLEGGGDLEQLWGPDVRKMGSVK